MKKTCFPRLSPWAFVLAIWLMGNALYAQTIFDKPNLLAWCIVPFDSVKRSPEERMAMLKRLGFNAYAYDWRTEHLASMETEFSLAKENNIEITGVWCWLDGRSDEVGKLSESNEQVLKAMAHQGLKAQLWVGFNANFFPSQDEKVNIGKGVAMVRYLADRLNQMGCSLMLYNHGDWIGEPANQITIIKKAKRKNVGMVYNFHHAHGQVGDFDKNLKAMLPYLKVVNINGMKVAGPKILTVGKGDEEVNMLKKLKQSGFKGKIGILGHVDQADVEMILKSNLEGLEGIKADLK